MPMIALPATPPAPLHTLGGRRATKIAPRPAAGLLRGPHPAAPRSVRQRVESCPHPHPATGLADTGRRQMRLPQQRKEAVDNAPELRVADYAKCVVSFAELSAVSLGEP